MRESDIEQLKRRARAEYERERTALQKSLEGLEIRYQARCDAIGWLATSNGATGNRVISPIDTALNKLSFRFTRMDVDDALGKSAPSRGTIVRELEQRVASRVLRIVVQGRGRRATVYEKVAAHAQVPGE